MAIGNGFYVEGMDSVNTGSESGNLWWNNNHPERDDYSLELRGTVVEIHDVLHTFKGVPSFFKPIEKGQYAGLQQPQRDWMLVLVTDDGREIRMSEAKHKKLWEQIWLSATMYGEPEPANEWEKRSKLPDALAGAHVIIKTKPKDQWPDAARPYTAMIDNPAPATGNAFRGYFDDYRTDTRWTESAQYQAWQERIAELKGGAKEAVQRLETANPKIAEIAKQHLGAAAAYADADIPF